MMEAIKDWYTDLEYFSSTPTVKYNKRYRVSSFSTKACSIFVLISYWALVLFKFKSWFFEESFSTGFSLSVHPKSESTTIDKKYIDFSVGAVDDDKKPFSLTDSTTIDNINGEGEKTVIGKMTHALEEKAVLIAELDKDVKLGGDLLFSTENSYFATTSFSVLTPEDSNKSQRINFGVDYTTYYLNDSNPRAEFGWEDTQQLFILSTANDYSVKLKFSKVNVAYKDGILFSLGGEEKREYAVLKEIKILQQPKQTKGKSKFTLDLEIMNEEINYRIEYEEFDSVLAKISGIYGFIMGFLTKIVGFFNQGIYEAYVGKCCYSLIPDQIGEELPTIESRDAVEEINPRPRPEIQASFLDSFRIFCYAPPVSKPFSDVFGMVEHEVDVVEVVKRNMYLSALRNKMQTEFTLTEDGRNFSLEDPVKQAEKENSPKEWYATQIN